MEGVDEDERGDWLERHRGARETAAIGALVAQREAQIARLPEAPLDPADWPQSARGVLLPTAPDESLVLLSGDEWRALPEDYVPSGAADYAGAYWDWPEAPPFAGFDEDEGDLLP